MKILALLVNLLGIPAVFFAGMAAMMSPMIFDAPGSSDSKSLWAALGCIVLLPLLLVLGEILGWKNFASGNYLASILAFKWAFFDVVAIVFLFWLAGF